MALIWAEGFTGTNALALLWRQYALAAARSQDTTHPPAEVGAAVLEAQRTRAAYDQAVHQAEDKLAEAATNGEPRTHALVVGVGRYASNTIPAVSTSVHGAWKFADWILTHSQQLARPLGSLDLLVSGSAGLAEWKPSPAAAAQLGLPSGSDSLPMEEATFPNIQNAFERLVGRARRLENNGLFFYFAGHGLWKSAPLLLPEDAQLATTTQPYANLINIQQTERNMFNVQPSVQCFFIDACQEITPALKEAFDAEPGRPLWSPTNAAVIPRRDAWLYFGSYAGRKAYGPKNEPPFFTQELLACLERRGAQSALDDDLWNVTTSSLRIALEAAAWQRRELEKENIVFSVAPGMCNFTADLCHFQGPPEVFLRLSCVPQANMSRAKLFVKPINGQPKYRAKALADEWYTTVGFGEGEAGAEVESAGGLTSTVKRFQAIPTLSSVQLKVQSAAPAGAGGSP